ncbi:hypothetical protein [Nocardioides endophyticus]
MDSGLVSGRLPERRELRMLLWGYAAADARTSYGQSKRMLHPHDVLTPTP